MAFSILGAGAAVLTIPIADTWLFIGGASAIYGLCLGSWYLLMPVLLADLFGTERISSSYGLVRMFQSVGAISVPPLAGYLKDLTGGYQICFYCMGACMVLGSLPLLVLSAADQDQDQSNEESEVSTVSNWTDLLFVCFFCFVLEFVNYLFSSDFTFHSVDL